MAVEHLPRNSTIPIHVDQPMFSGTTPLTADAANLNLKIIQLESGLTYDQTDNKFRSPSALPNIALVAYGDYAYDYQVLVPQTTNWPRGTYRAMVTHTSDGRTFTYDFTLGLSVPRQLGYSAVYDGSTLNLAVWVEEFGEAQTDYISLTNCKVLSAAGVVLPDGVFPDNTTPTSGIFNFVRAVNLAPITNYVFSCTANVAGPSGRPNYSFPLKLGLARP